MSLNQTQQRALIGVRRVSELLLSEYGRPRLGNPRDPLDDLIFIVLSNKTGPETASRVYRQLKQEFPSWAELLSAPARRVRQILRPAGLSRIKTAYIRRALRKIRNDWGDRGLSALRGMSATQAEEYLCSLPGVSLKVAKCVVMYTLGGQVLPVDAHVHRIAVRLGWTERKRADQCHEELEAAVPSRFRYGLHVGMILHGRLVCRPDRPICTNCAIRKLCDFYKLTSHSRPKVRMSPRTKAT